MLVAGEVVWRGEERTDERPSGVLLLGLDWAGLGNRGEEGGGNGGGSQGVHVPRRWTGLASVEVRRMDGLFIHSFVCGDTLVRPEDGDGCVYKLHPHRSFGHHPSPHN